VKTNLDRCSLSNQKPLKLFWYYIAIFLVYLSQPLVQAGDLRPFPNPLSLSEALEMIDESHPSILSQKALRAEIETEILRIDSDLDLEANLSKDLVDQLEINARSNLRIQVIQAFFEVLVADLGFLSADEEMTLTYLEFEDTEDEFERDEVTEIEVLEKQVRYLDSLGRREALSGQRSESRLRLALALNRVDSMPDLLIEPDMSGYDREVPEYQKIISKILEFNPRIKAARLQMESRQSELGLKQKLWADQAEIANFEHHIRRSTFQLIQRLNQLNIERRAAQAELLYREYSLDKVRLQYEMEVKVRLGLANTMVAKALTRVAKTNYEIGLTWEKLDALTASEPNTFQ
jgi:hypothetical protein